MKNLARTLITAGAVLAPLSAFAATGAGNILVTLNDLINMATPIVVALALLGFFWGLAVFIFNAGDEAARKKGKSIMIYGVLALFIMLSVFGIISVLQSTLQIGPGQTNPINIPAVNTNL